MSREQTYLVAVDAEADIHPAIERAAWLAGRTGAKLELFIVEHVHSLIHDPTLRARLVAGDHSRFEEIARRLRDQGLTAEVDVRWDHPEDDAILRKISESTPALVFKDTHHHSALQRTLFSSVDWNLIRRCPAPLWLVKNRPLRKPPRLLASVDPSRAHGESASLDEEILSTTKTLSKATSGNVQILHVINPIPAGAALSAAGGPETAGVVFTDPLPQDHEFEERRRAALDQLVMSIDMDIDDVRVEHGQPADLIVETADDLNADIVVMGAVSRNAIQNALIGNTAERVLDRLPCDLLVAKQLTGLV